MAIGFENQEGVVVPENLKRQLALAVRSIQWSYAIFWSISDRQPGVLAWGDGYYNGDIKTRKTVQSVELNADQLGLQRSEQLRELYESLSAAEASPQQARRPSASLSPEDLTDTEWYYLVCMSFGFNIDQGLPGKTLANGRPIWLCNAHWADSKMFSRSLLAKSASIQTVVCFPFLRGVVELGVTDLVAEDLNLIQRIRTSFLEPPYAMESNASAFDQEMNTNFVQVVGSEGIDIIISPNDSSNYEPVEDSFMVEGMEGDEFMDDDFSNCIHPSVNSSDCISQAIVDPVKVIPLPREENANGRCVQDLQECNKKLPTIDLESGDLHYHGILSSLLKTSHPLVLGPNFQRSCLHESSFVGWKKQGLMNSQKSKGPPQKLLKKILYNVPQMHLSGLVDTSEDDRNKVDISRPEADEIGPSHVLQERKRREKLNERFTILKSIIPCIRKVDKVSVLDDTIEYVRGLERRVEELESFRDLKESEATTKRRLQDTAERTSDNYRSNRIGTRAQLMALANKRKASDVEDLVEAELHHQHPSNDSLPEEVVAVQVNGRDVIIEIKCPWREGILLEFMDAISHLHVDSHAVHSSNTNGILSLTINSKHKGLNVASAGKIKQTLQRVALKS